MVITPNRNKAWFFSGLLHLLLIALFLFYNISSAESKLEEEGVSVTLGLLDESSLGLEAIGEQKEDPSASESEPSPPPPPSQPVKTKEATIVDKTSDAKIKSDASKTKTTSINPKSTTKPTSENSKPTESTSSSETNSKNTAQDEVNEKKKKFGSLFGSGGQGTKEGDGNQGDPNGNPDSKVLEGISTGRGTIGGGLSGRKITNAPVISESSQKTGRVVVKICVDKNGKVISAKFTQAGSTTTDSHLVKIAEKGAMKYEFVPGELDNQCGTLTFDFKLS